LSVFFTPVATSARVMGTRTCRSFPFCAPPRAPPAAEQVLDPPEAAEVAHEDVQRVLEAEAAAEPGPAAPPAAPRLTPAWPKRS
jgi:hypothetical protein